MSSGMTWLDSVNTPCTALNAMRKKDSPNRLADTTLVGKGCPFPKCCSIHNGPLDDELGFSRFASLLFSTANESRVVEFLGDDNFKAK